jgi:hypothetical protein
LADMIVGLFGLKRSGKDSLADHLVNSFGYKKFHFADNLRDVMWEANLYVSDTGERLQDVVNRIGWEESKETYPEVRRIMKDLGTNGCRKVLGQHVWIDALEKQIDATPGRVVIADGRFLDESQWVKSNAGVVVKVQRDWGATQEKDLHRSESEIDLINEHILVNNNANLDGLRDEAKRINSYVNDLESRMHY